MQMGGKKGVVLCWVFLKNTLYRGGSGNCGQVSHSVHMLLYNHIDIGKYLHMANESQLAAFRFHKYQGQVWAKQSFIVVK